MWGVVSQTGTGVSTPEQRRRGKVPFPMNLRIEEGQRLLTETSLSITDIARRVSFYGQKHLSALFKRNVGIPPLPYRKQTFPLV